jgi:glycosyltransferase involved in cell wall biosynthesis
MKVVILSSLSWSLINFRGALIARMVEAGHDVVACAPDGEPEVIGALSKMGVRFRLTPMARAGTNPLRDTWTFFHYWRLLRSERPDVVVAYTQKPIIYGGLATRLLGRARFYAIMSGLGYVFSSEADNRPLLRSTVSRLYRLGVRRADCIFVFNGDDRRLMLENGIVAPDQPVMQVPGSGIDTAHFAQQPLPDGPPTFLMMGRLMRDKGVGEYVEAARIVRETRPDVRFMLLTRPETENPTGYTAQDLDAWRRAGLIEFVPETRDVRPFIAAAHVFVLPSFYREGLPRTILEALATGRPVITTDMPGCREPIEEGVNGLLIPPRDAPALAAAMTHLLDNPDLLAAMAQAARQKAIHIYDVDKVNRLLMEVLGLSNAATAPVAAWPPEPDPPVLKALPGRRSAAEA